MTRPEITGKRDLKFSGWIRENLPDSNTGFLVSDFDFVLCNKRTKQMMMLEIKTRNKKVPKWQYELFRNIANSLRLGMKNFMPKWTFVGYHIITFENTFFDDGNVYFNDRLTNEKELIEKLSME